MSMQAGTYQVTLTGVRTRTQDESALHAALLTRFRLAPEQVSRMLSGRQVVKRGIDERTARALAAVFVGLGLEATVESAVAQPTSPTSPATTTPTTPKPAAAAKTEPARATAAAGNVALDALLALGNQRLPRPRTGVLYVTALLMVTLLCLAIPVFYVALTGAIAYGWIWFLTHYHEFMPRNIYAVVLGYAVPGVVGAVLVMFLLRPLFLRRGTPSPNVRLDPQLEPEFFAGIRALCKAIGVSPPREIWLEHHANASVHYRTRWLSLFTGHKVLTIGMSLVTGSTARQFVGVMAHEFGHFAQRAGMAFSFVVNSVNAWLEHRAYGADSWEQKIGEYIDSREGDESAVTGIMMTCAVVSLFAIAFIRRLMRGLFELSIRVSRHMSRQMEFDADRYEALLAGSTEFRTTARNLRALSHSFAEVNSANIDAWRDGRLLRDLPDAVAAHFRQFDAKRLAAIEEEMAEHTTARFWDSHPPDVERVRNAENQQAPGIYVFEEPATSLFRDFGTWSRRVTSLFYREQGVQYTPANLCPRDEVLGRMQAANDRDAEIERYFNGQFRLWPVMKLEPGDLSKPPDWQQSIDELRRRSPDIAKAWSQAEEANGRRVMLMTAIRLQVSSKELGMPGPDRTVADMEVELGNIAGRRLEYEKPMGEALALYARRIAFAIATMPGPQRARAEQLAQAIRGIEVLSPVTAQLSQIAGALRNFARIAENNAGKYPAGFELLEKNFADTAAELLHKADGLPQEAVAGDTIGGYLRSRCPHLAESSQEAGAYSRAAWPVLEACESIYLLALGELVGLCAGAEKSHGIRPIKLASSGASGGVR